MVKISSLVNNLSSNDIEFFHTFDCFRYPIVPGHELAGIVTDVGSNVTKFKVTLLKPQL